MGRCQNHDFKYHRTNISLSGHSRTLPNEHLTIRAFTNIDTNKKNCMMKVLFPLISELSVLLYKHSLRRVPLVKQVLVILPGFSGIHVTRSFMCVLWIVVCPFVLFFWSLCRLSFFDLRILVTPLVSFSSSHKRSLQGRIQDFKLGGTLKKIRPSGGRREICGVFCVKNHDFTPKKSYIFQF